jgi:Na+-transporting NADH:ubiquinone oxidoreductase subunit NqrC
MKDSRLYTVVYSLVLCAACAALLTFASTFWDKEIKANEQFFHTRAVVDAMGMCQADTPRSEVMKIYTAGFEAKKQGEMDVIEGRKDGKLVGYAFDLVTQGKYGIIRGVLAVSAGKDKILGFRIYQQTETPGLGGRISEPGWLAQFTGKPLMTDGVPGIIISNGVKGPNVIDAITGASKTTFSLGRALNGLIASFLAGGMALQPLDLDLSVDAVTRATPGYPKNLQKPPHLRTEVRRADFMVPLGLTNVALNRPVTSSMTEDPIIGSLKQLTDGVKRSGEFDFVELDPDPQWVQVDLGRSCTLSCVVVWHYYKNPVIYNDVIVQLADDAGFTSNVRTVFNNDHDNTSGQGAGTDTAYFARWWGEIVDTRGASKEGTAARFIRVWTNGGCGGEPTRFVEIQAYGK